MGDDPERLAAWLEAGRQRLRVALWPEPEGEEQERTEGEVSG